MASDDVFVALGQRDISAAQYALRVELQRSEDALLRYPLDSDEYWKTVSLVTALRDAEDKLNSVAALHSIPLIEHHLDMWNAFPPPRNAGGTSPTR